MPEDIIERMFKEGLVRFSLDNLQPLRDKWENLQHEILGHTFDYALERDCYVIARHAFSRGYEAQEADYHYLDAVLAGLKGVKCNLSWA